MIPQVSTGSNPSGLMAYLVGKGDRNEHTDPHLVAGSPDTMAWYSHGPLAHGEGLEVAGELNQAHRVYGVDVKGGHVWHCSLSLPKDDGVLSDERWEQLATEFMQRMEFIDVEGKEDVQWVAVRHGLSGTNQNDHVHIVASLVRHDGTKADTWMDYRRAQTAAREMEKAHGLFQVKGDLSPVIGKKGEAEAAQARGRIEPERDTLERSVRAASVASSSEDEFVRRLRGDGLLVRASYGKDEQVRGYSVALVPVKDERPVYFGGSSLGRDLGLGVLRQRWEQGDEQRVAAGDEWRAATRGLRVVAPGREQQDPTFSEGEVGKLFSQWHDRLAAMPVDDKEGWRSAASDLSGVFAHWSKATEPKPGALAAVSSELSRSAQLAKKEYRPAPRSGELGVRTSAMLTWLSTQDDVRAVLGVLPRMTALAAAVRDHQVERHDLVRERGLERVARERLLGLHEGLEARAGVSAPARAAAVQQSTRGPSVLPQQYEKTTQQQPSRAAGIKG